MKIKMSNTIAVVFGLLGFIGFAIYGFFVSQEMEIILQRSIIAGILFYIISFLIILNFIAPLFESYYETMKKEIQEEYDKNKEEKEKKENKK